MTGIGPVVEGPDGSISISVDVTAYHPPASGIAAPGTSTLARAAGGIAAGVDAAGAVDDTSPPPPPPDPARGDGSDADGRGPGTPVPDVTEVIHDTTTPERHTPPPTAPDGTDPGAYADWVGRSAGGTLPPGDIASLGGLIRGNRTEATLTGTFSGPWAPLLGSTESRTDGVAVKFPTGDRLLVRVRDGRVEVRHEASLLSVFADAVADQAAEAGVKIPKVEDTVAAATGPLDGFNRAVAANGREVEAVTRNPDGTITIRTRPKS